MGRNKIKIEAKEDSYDQSVTYGKRRNGLLKKAKELSLLCDVPLVLLFSSPRNKDSYQAFLGEQSTLEQLINQYAVVPPKERHDRRVEAFNRLKKPFQKQGQNIDVHSEIIGRQSAPSELEILQKRFSEVQAEVKEIEKALGPLSFLKDIDSINDIKLLEGMEKTLQNALAYNTNRSVNL